MLETILIAALAGFISSIFIGAMLIAPDRIRECEFRLDQLEKWQRQKQDEAGQRPFWR